MNIKIIIELYYRIANFDGDISAGTYDSKGAALAKAESLAKKVPDILSFSTKEVWKVERSDD